MASNQADTRSVSVFGGHGKSPPQDSEGALAVDQSATITRPVYLSDCSPRDKRWDRRKDEARQVASIFANAPGKWHRGLGERIYSCADSLEMALVASPTDPESQILKLAHSEFCRVRVDPICQWRRSLKWSGRFRKAIPQVAELHPMARWIYAVLTQKNVAITDLRETLSAGNDAWARLRKRKEFRPAEKGGNVMGWFRTVEVTRGEDGSAHPHSNLLMLVSPEYFRHGNYLDQPALSRLWGECSHLNYDPRVWIETVKPKSRRGRPTQNPFDQPTSFDTVMNAVHEVAKYATKPADLVADPAWLLTYTNQVDRLRFVSSGGILKPLLGDTDEGKETDEEMIGHDDSASTSDSEALSLWFDYIEPARRYALRPDPSDD
jgi:plasmid rolling circle replication initiator protein Rep